MYKPIQGPAIEGSHYILPSAHLLLYLGRVYQSYDAESALDLLEAYYLISSPALICRSVSVDICHLKIKSPEQNFK